jgi:hypothetical protein
MFLTSQLVLSVFMLAVEKHKITFLAPIGIGLTLFVDHLVGVYHTGCGVNPARSFGPDVVIGNFPGYHWIYCTGPSPVLVNQLGVGPSLGALLASAVYKVLKFLKYHEVNGTQDRESSPSTPLKSEKPSISSTTIHDPGNCGKRKGSKRVRLSVPKSEVLDPSVGMIDRLKGISAKFPS